MAIAYSSSEENYYVREAVKQGPYALIQLNNHLLSIFFLKGYVFGVGVQRGENHELIRKNVTFSPLWRQMC